MRIVILGGDGYLGWPSAMHFSQRGHEVTVVDNYFRRNAAVETDSLPLYSVPTLPQRARLWHELTGKEIRVVIGDLREPSLLTDLFAGRVRYDFAVTEKPWTDCEAILHYGNSLPHPTPCSARNTRTSPWSTTCPSPIT